MTLRDLFKIKAESPPPADERMRGKIIHLDVKGWGFISAKDIPYTRIFFHWTGLEGDTLNFAQLEKGMKVEFIAKDKGDRGWCAIKIRVVEDDRLRD